MSTTSNEIEMAMPQKNSLLEVSLYLKGTELDVEGVSRRLGVTPTKVNRRGEPKVRAQESPTYATTTWKFSRKAESRDVNGTLIELLDSINMTTRPMDMEGVDDAFIDVFLAQTVEPGELGSSIEWTLSAEALVALQRIGLSVRFSVCNVEP